MHVKEKLTTFCKLLKAQAVESLLEIRDIQVMECGYKQGHRPPEGTWLPLTWLQGPDRHYWLRFSFRTPAAEAGSEYILSCSTGITGWDANNPQGLLYLNGQMIQGLDINHTEAFLEADTAYEALVYFYTGVPADPFPFQVQVQRRYGQVDGLYYDLITPLEALELLHSNTAEYGQILTALEQAVNLVDARAVYSDRYFASVDAARDFLAREFYEKLCSPEGKPVIHCIGHTHIDVEWLWTRAQTREKTQRSFATANALMEKYPEYPFTMTQPELYRYLKEEAPEKYAQLKAWVEKGRWEPEGAMWVECDCNLVSGESFVRQLLEGKRFFREEFGKESRVLFLPDVFGYSAALPQILKKSGIDYFVTSKISWNETNTLPVDAFLWQGIDGTEIFTNFITANIGLKNHEFERKTTYHSLINAPYVVGCWNRYQQKDVSPHALLIFGYGDGGGGPTREDLEKQRRLQRGIPGLPVTKMDHLLPYLRTTEQAFLAHCDQTGRTPKWVGELYLEFHRGTYTSVAKNKRANRKSELLLQKAEALSAAHQVFGGSYDQEGLYQAWRKVLHDQFHDILPGSSVHQVYEGTDRDYAQVGEYCRGLIQSKLSSVAASLSGGTLVYNSLGFARTGSICADGQTLELTEPIPAFGWQVISPTKPQSRVRVEGLTAENDHYLMQLDEAGQILSLYDKAACRQVFQAPGNCFVTYEDLPYRYDNWEISDYYGSKAYPLAQPAVITPVFDGDRAGFRVEKTFDGNTIVQHIWLWSHSRRIDLDHEIQWSQHHRLLKLHFPMDLHTDEASFEIQYGHVRRPTHQNTSWDQARFEVCAHKWVDLSENGYGVALLNDCKYGYSTDGSTLMLTVLKAGTYPTDQVDLGMHRFSCALLPHTGSLYDGQVIRESYSFNQPLEALPCRNHADLLPRQFCLATCQQKNILLETVKKAEDDDGLILRLYDSFGCRSRATVKVAKGFKKAFLCNLMEAPLQELPFDGSSVTLPVKPFEIVTLKFTR